MDQGDEDCAGVKFALLPHLDNALVSIETGNGEVDKVLRWTLITNEVVHLKHVLESCADAGESLPLIISDSIEECIRTYAKVEGTFKILQEACSAWNSDSNRTPLKDVVLFIADAALTIPTLCEAPIPFLDGARAGHEMLQFSKDQLCSLLANAFLCTFPGRDTPKSLKDYPRINFFPLFDDSDNFGTGWKARIRQAKVEKVKCFLNYFSRMRTTFGKNTHEDHVVTFERRSLSPDNLPRWENVKDGFCNLTLHSAGAIENAVGSLQVDFANKFVGGGTLGNGAAMEEIRFATCPQLVVAQLFTKKLGPLDTLLVHFFEQFTSHRGYASTFQNDHHLQNHLVCMDAFQFPLDSTSTQFEKLYVDRELNKCASAFQPSLLVPETYSSVASGKWGCGVFNGDPLLKCLIQWMAASYFWKSLRLYTFGDTGLSGEMLTLRDFILSRPHITVGKLYSIILSYGKACSTGENIPDLSEYIVNSIRDEERSIEQPPQVAQIQTWIWSFIGDKFGWILGSQSLRRILQNFRMGRGW